MHSYAVNTDRLRCYIIIGLICVFLTPLANNGLEEIHFLSKLQPWVSSGPSFFALYVLVFSLYNKVAWKWSALKYVGLPVTANLNGTFTGKLTSSYKGGTSIPLTVEIVQDWTKMVIYTTAGTETSESYSCMSSQFDIDGKSTRLTYSYTNNPFNAIADPDMQSHDGTANLVFRKSGKVKGTYFNARTRTGTIELKKRSKKTSSSI
jgi:hypothetical protein